MKKPVIHVSLNPSPKDILSEEQLIILAKEFMEKMGYGQQPYVVWQHKDIERQHLHIVSVRIDDQGNKIDHNYEAIRAMKICREMEQKYGLHPVNESQAVALNNEIRELDYPKGNLKNQIKNIVRSLLEIYHMTSLSELNNLLNLYHISVYEVKGKVENKEFHGIVYSALDEKGQSIGTPVKSSKLGEQFGYKKLQKKFAESSKIIKNQELNLSTKRCIIQAMQNITTKENFARKLRDNNIEVIFRSNPGGRLFGITFIDHNTRTVYKGSSLGKAFSANVFHELFYNPDADRQKLIPEMKMNKEEETIPLSEKESLPILQEKISETESFKKSIFSDDFSALGAIDLFSVLLEEEKTHEYIDPAFRFRKRKKRKSKKPKL